MLLLRASCASHSVDFGFGVRIPVAEEHGPIARVACVDRLRGNDANYFSLLDAPQGQFGYQFVRGRVGFERWLRRSAGQSRLGRASMVSSAVDWAGSSAA